MTPKDPFLEGTFWDKFLRPIRSRALLFTPELLRKTRGGSGKKKAHKHKFFCPVGLGTTPGVCRGFRRVCPWDKFCEYLGQTRVFSLFCTVEARQTRLRPPGKPGLSLGQTRVCPGGTESLCEKSLCSFFALAKGWNCRFQKSPRTEGGDKVPAVWTQGSRQVCLSRCRKS